MPEDRAWNETLIEKNVTYHIEFGGRLFLIENVPAASQRRDGREALLTGDR